MSLTPDGYEFDVELNGHTVHHWYHATGLLDFCSTVNDGCVVVEDVFIVECVVTDKDDNIVFELKKNRAASHSDSINSLVENLLVPEILRQEGKYIMSAIADEWYNNNRMNGEYSPYGY